MYEYLTQKAKEQVWCNPIQDNQWIIRPQRITKGTGAIGAAIVLGRELDLPSNHRTHVYQVGQIPPALLGLLETNPSWQKETWFTFSEAMNVLPLYANIYNETGINVPRSQARFMYTREKCLIIAIKVDKRIKINYGSDNIYIRLYTSAFLKGDSLSIPRPLVEVRTYEPTNVNEILVIKDEYEQAKARQGHVEAFVNGNLVNDITVFSIAFTDIVEWVYEASVKKVVTWKVRDLLPFTSTMDQMFKYILHYPKSQVTDVIDFQDDIDIYIQATVAPNQTKGRYYVKNRPEAMRMLTHRDYSISSDFVDFISRALADDFELITPDLLDFQVVMKVREGGYSRNLIKDANRIFELYKLTDQRIMMAMTGINSTVPVWRASHLESSAYTAIMRSLEKDITIDQVELGYGYNSIAKVLADTPTKTFNIGGQQVATLPYGLARDSTVYEYDGNGKLLGYFYHENDDDYEAHFPNTRLVEGLMGKGTDAPNVVYGTNNLTLTPKADWRLYKCQLDFSHNPPIPNNIWVDITDTPGLYEVVAGKINWIGEESDQYLMLRSNDKFLAYNFQTTLVNGNIIFSLSETTIKDGVNQLRVMDIPAGDLQIFLNGNNMVHGIDYVIKFPYVCINNQSYFRQPADTQVQDIHIRFTGFCDKTLKLYPPKDSGFVINGVLSNNKRYDAVTDKIQHISVAGSVLHPSDVRYYEDHPQWRPIDPSNGKPYQLKNLIVPLKDFTPSGTYPLLKAARVIDKQVDDYMSLYWEKPTDEPVGSIQMRWRLTSPFIACMIDLCSSGQLTFVDTTVLADHEVIQICRPYEPLLEYDPINQGSELPSTYVNITPTRYPGPVNVSRAEYRFLEAVTRLYGEGKVGLNNFLTFTI